MRELGEYEEKMEVAKQAVKSIKQFIGAWLSLGKRNDGVSLIMDFSLWILGALDSGQADLGV